MFYSLPSYDRGGQTLDDKETSSASFIAAIWSGSRDSTAASILLFLSCTVLTINDTAASSKRTTPTLFYDGLLVS